MKRLFPRQTRKIYVGFFLALLCAFFIGSLFSGRSKNEPVESPDTPRKSLRIVSTAPSITETLFAVGLGDCVAAVSDYCKYPESVSELPKIGSLYDYNVEAIAELAPDFVVVLKENEVLPPKLASLGIETFSVDHASLEGVLESFESLTNRAKEKRPDAPERGAALRREMETRIEKVRSNASKYPKTKSLVAIYRQVGRGVVGEAHIAGRNPYFNSVLEIAGGENVAENLTGVAPIVSAEGIVELNPEVVLDLSTDGVNYEGEELRRKTEEHVRDWQSLGDAVDAVRNKRVYPIFDDFATVPGPRSVLFLEKLAGLLHPELSRTDD